jgi:ubiquinone/menaquinone biosynthesis C-methylase UbiE
MKKRVIDTDLNIKSYRDYRRLIKGHTAKSLHEMYDDIYFEKHVGSKEMSDVFFKSLGLTETKYTKIPLEIAQIKAGDIVLDIGCGRGEMVFQSANKKAHATGIDYSEAAIKIARNIQEKHTDDIRSRITFLCCNAENLDFGDNTFDTAFLLDVVEHVSQSELYAILREIRRVLKTDGRLIIHTTPNIWSRSVGYRLKSIAKFFLTGKTAVHPIVAQFQQLKSDPDYNEDKLFLHINEQSVLSMKMNLMKCGFKSRVWLNNSGNIWASPKGFINSLISILYKLSGLKYIFGSDIYVVALPVKK